MKPSALAAKAITIFILAALSSCSRKADEPQPGPTPGPTPEPEPTKEYVFYEDFSKCTMKEGVQIQSDNFKQDCENPLSHIHFKSAVWKTVGNSHVCDESYLQSRGFSEWVYLFRTVENEGCLACGVNSEGKRGIIQSPMLNKIDKVQDIKVSFKLKPAKGMNDGICFKVCLAGIIRSATVNGKSVEIAQTHQGIEHILVIPANYLSADWNPVTVDVEKATDGTMLYWGGNSSSTSLNHGFYLDEIAVEKAADMTKAEHNLRVLFWNIQNGMWSDQAAGYANFKAFIEKYDPDVCVWCEGQSIYKDGTTSSMPAASRHFPGAWEEFARSYGHSYSAISGYRIYADDYFPQIITSRYPITTLVKITETDAEHIALAAKYTDGKSHASEYHATCGKDYCPVAHGAAVQQIDFNGTRINFVTLHLWPHAYSYYYKYVSKDSGSGNTYGNRQRLEEMKYICSKSIGDPMLKGEANWLMMGDFNTRSRLDNWFYKIDEGSDLLSTHDYLLENTFYKDIIGLKYPGHFFATRTWVNDGGGIEPPRYDFMYASPAMYNKVRNALILNESYTNMVWATSNFYNSSDHRPILVDFEF